MTKSYKDHRCPYCGAGVGEACRVTLATEDREILSIEWSHRARQEVAAA